MKKIQLRRSLAWLLLLLTLLAGCGNPAASAPASSGSTQPKPSKPDPEPEPEPPVVATLAVCGDTMSHMPQTRDAWDDALGDYDYKPMIAAAKPYVEGADFAVANLETTFSGGPDYSGFPAFNTPDALADAMKDAGFDLLLTANNHCMDRGYDGLCRTLDVLDQRGLLHVGTYRTAEERAADRGIRVVDIGGISAAFLGYTYGTNGIPVHEDKKFSVNVFNTDYMSDAVTPDEELIREDLAAARALGTDLIIVMTHWGIEYQTTQNEHQEKFADLLFANGADIILGGHSHVPQPMELRRVTGPDGKEKQGFVLFSLGNFISSQNDPITDTTAVLNLELTRDPETGKTTVSDVNYVPLLMLDREKGADKRFELLDCYAVRDNADWPESIRNKAATAIEDCHSILGAGFDFKAAAQPENTGDAADSAQAA